MKNTINILGNNQIFTYLIEYNRENRFMTADINYWKDDNNVYVVNDDTLCYRRKNDWLIDMDSKSVFNEYIPKSNKISTLKIYVPAHNLSTYTKGVKYVCTVNTWIHGIRIDLGSFLFGPNDTVANQFGTVRRGNNEYFEYFEFDILDPFDIVYSDKWLDFRKNVCKEPEQLNNTGSQIYVSLYAVEYIENRYMIHKDYVGGSTCFNMSNDTDFMKLNMYVDDKNDHVGLRFNITTNSEYDWFLSYLLETYNINTSHNNIKYEIVIKNKDSIIIGPLISYNGTESFGNISQIVKYEQLMSSISFREFFSTWEIFEEGWCFSSSLMIYNDEGDEIFNIVSNEIPITQEVYSRFVNGCSEKIIDLKDMNVINYNIINKIENKIVQIDRPNESKENIIQPVFFKVKDTELLTLHPNVTENICINLDEYKNKVERFILQIDGNKFRQIGANNYGIIFKITGNILAKDLLSGTYYVLDENHELITTGKYTCVR